MKYKVKLSRNELLYYSVFCLLMFMPHILFFVFPSIKQFLLLTEYPGWYIYLVVLFVVSIPIHKVIRKKENKKGDRFL